MALDKKSQMIEDLLDQGLKEYGRVAPRPGLEGRVLANLHAESVRQVGLWGRWTVRAIALAAGLALALLIAWRPSAKAPEAPPIVSKAEPASPSAITPPQIQKPPQPLKASARRRVVPDLVPPKRLDQFPSPRPLSSQEELLLAYVHEAPAEEVVAMAQRARRTEELHVQDLDVTPLNVDQLGTITEQK